MFVVRWLLAAAAFCEHVNQLVSVCLSLCVSVSPLYLIRGVSISAVLSPPFSTSPFLPHPLCRTPETSELRKPEEVLGKIDGKQ